MAVRVEIEVDGQPKFIGMLEGGTLYIERSKKKHFYRKLNAYAMDRDLVETILPDMDCFEIRLREQETDDYYTVSLDTFKRKALPNQYGNHGAQLFLPLRYWTKS